MFAKLCYVCYVHIAKMDTRLAYWRRAVAILVIDNIRFSLRKRMSPIAKMAHAQNASPVAILVSDVYK